MDNPVPRGNPYVNARMVDKKDLRVYTKYIHPRKQMHAHIQKWGNSLAIRIPMGVAKQLHLQPGSPVTVEIEEGRLIVQPPKYNLESMLKAITAKNRHHQLLEDPQAGSEEW